MFVSLKSITSSNCQYDTIRQHEYVFSTDKLLTLSQVVLAIGILEMILLCFDMQGEDVHEHNYARCHLCTL